MLEESNVPVGWAKIAEKDSSALGQFVMNVVKEPDEEGVGEIIDKAKAIERALPVGHVAPGAQDHLDEIGTAHGNSIRHSRATRLRLDEPNRVFININQCEIGSAIAQCFEYLGCRTASETDDGRSAVGAACTGTIHECPDQMTPVSHGFWTRLGHRPGFHGHAEALDLSRRMIVHHLDREVVSSIPSRLLATATQAWTSQEEWKQNFPPKLDPGWIVDSQPCQPIVRMLAPVVDAGRWCIRIA